MPQQLTYPGIYVEEIPSGVHTITGVPTSVTAFAGRALRGPVAEPVLITGFGDYERTFGGLWTDSTMSYAVYQYFLNGGANAVIVRLFNPVTSIAESTARLSLPVNRSDHSVTPLILNAVSPGAWGNNLRAVVDYDTATGGEDSLFNLTVTEEIDKVVLVSEQFLNVTISEPNSPRFLPRVLATNSRLVRVEQSGMPSTRPLATNGEEVLVAEAVNGTDGDVLEPANFDDGTDAFKENKQGLYALEKTDIFNILCIPPLQSTRAISGSIDIPTTVWEPALRYCEQRRAILLVDPPIDWTSVATAEAMVDDLNLRSPNSALYFPNVRMADPLRNNALTEFAPCGAVAGVMARTDAQRGVWKAPAGVDASLRGVGALAVNMTDPQNGRLNPIGINCLRTQPAFGHVVWGARTLRGADRLASEWKYLPVRRLALYIEESLQRGTQWAVFEPNDESLWAQLRMNVGAFMHELFAKGAFAGASPRDSYFVRCDRDTTTASDINSGIVNVVIGFAPTRPAEFIVLKIQQVAGQSVA